ncbi:MAG: hypothetical protein AAF126_03060 [Chloroflexota bacterium]
MSSVRVEGADEIASLFRRSGGIFDRVARGWLRDQSIDAVNTVQRNTLNVGAVDTNELIQGTHYDISRDSDGVQSVIGFSDKANEYAVYVEEGTRPHFPPLDAIRPWADRHGIPAFLVARKIAREGTDPRYFMRDSFVEVQRDVDRNLDRLLDQIMQGFE